MATSQLYRSPSSTRVTRKPSTGSSCSPLSSSNNAFCELGTSGRAMAAAEGPGADFRLGDVNADGKITTADARFALRKAVDLETYAPDSREFLACDVDRSGSVTTRDARKILRAAVGLDDPATW